MRVTSFDYAIITPPDTKAEYCDDRVCLSVFVCLSASEHISRTARPIFAKFFAHTAYGRDSVIFWRRCDMFCTSGFMNDVMFARNGHEEATQIGVY